MGWFAIYKDTLQVVKEEDSVSRPMEDGQDGKLLAIGQSDYGHNVLVDLMRGIFLIDFEEIKGLDTGTPQVVGAKTYLNICDETNIGADLQELVRTEPDAEGNYQEAYKDLQWRPIWFTRHVLSPVGEILVKCIGAQTTLPEEFGGKNLKSYISLFPDARIGITDGIYILGGGNDNATATS